MSESTLVVQKESVPSWITYIRRRIERNKNFLGFISGPTGSGKSYTSLEIARQCDPEFDIERCVFSGRELMALINGGKLKSGSAIVFEEVGVGLSARSWQSTINKMLNFLLQTFRHKNFILIMNSPYMDFVDTQTRRLFHAEFQTLHIDREKKVCVLKPLCIQYNSEMKKFYRKYLRVCRRGQQGAVPLMRWGVPLLPEDLREAYEKKKTDFTSALNRDIETELCELYGGKKKELTLRQARILELIKNKKSMKEIVEDLNVQQCEIYKQMTHMRDKGYNISPVYTEDNRVSHYEVL